jgi:hypothetical protein
MALTFRSCSVYAVDKLKAEFEKNQALRRRISKSKRPLAGVRLPKNIETSLMAVTATSIRRQRRESELETSGEISFQALRDAYYADIGLRNYTSQQRPEPSPSKEEKTQV